eukprot:5337571-Ditylum_brightwellii.AAC.1
MVRIVKEYDEAATDFKTVVVDSPQQPSRHAPLDTPIGTRHADPQHPRLSPQKVDTPRGVGSMLKAMSGKKANRRIRFSTGYVCRKAVFPLGCHTPQ